MTDAWKGAHLISAKGIEARKQTTMSLASSIAHKRRAAKGENMSRAGGPWASSFTAWKLEALNRK